MEKGKIFLFLKNKTTAWIALGLLSACSSDNPKPIMRNAQQGVQVHLAPPPEEVALTEASHLTLGRPLFSMRAQQPQAEACVRGKVTREPVAELARGFEVSAFRVNNRSDLRSALGPWGGDSWLFGLAHGDSLSSFFRSTWPDSSSLNGVMVFTYVIARYGLAQPNLVPEAVQLAHNRGWAEFYDLCGDSFLSRIALGDKLYVYFSVPKSNESLVLENQLSEINQVAQALDFLQKIKESNAGIVNPINLSKDYLDSHAHSVKLNEVLDDMKNRVAHEPKLVAADSGSYFLFSELEAHKETSQKPGGLSSAINTYKSLVRRMDFAENELHRAQQFFTNFKGQWAEKDAQGVSSYINQLSRSVQEYNIFKERCSLTVSQCENYEQNLTPVYLNPPVHSAHESCGIDLFREAQDAQVCGSDFESVPEEVVAPGGEGRHPDCGVELYREGLGEVCGIGFSDSFLLCRHPSFGVELYKSCYHSSFTHVERRTRLESHARTCRAPEFGVEQYRTCWHF